MPKLQGELTVTVAATNGVHRYEGVSLWVARNILMALTRPVSFRSVAERCEKLGFSLPEEMITLLVVDGKGEVVAGAFQNESDVAVGISDWFRDAESD